MDKPIRKSRRKYKWYKWNFDDDGDAYVIAKDECPIREDVPRWIVKNDHLSPEVLSPTYESYLSCEDVREGWCKFQVRTDWSNDDGDATPRGWYVVTEYEPETKNMYGKRKPGWFPVWIIRTGDWY